MKFSVDSRTIEPGAVFWAIRARRDGHDFVSSALQNGAALAVVDRQWLQSPSAASHRNRLIGVENTGAALAMAAREWRTHLTAPLIAITGSNGKTTTKDFLVHFLKSKYKTAGTAGNFNNELGVPLTLLGMGADSAAIVIEMGASKQGDIRYLCEIADPDHGLVTSIAAAHLQGFGSLDGVANAKGELYAHVARRGISFVPTEDPRCVEQSRDAARSIGYGFSAPPSGWDSAFVHGDDLEFDRNGCASFMIGGETFRHRLPGKPIAVACLAAAAAAMQFGVSAKECAQRAPDAPITAGRAAVIRAGNLTILDDSYNANPASMRAALETLQSMPGRHKVAMLGDMNELGDYAESEHEALGKLVSQLDIDHLYLFGELSRITARSARGASFPVDHLANASEIGTRLDHIMSSSDTILIKASRGIGLDRIVAAIKEMLN